MAQMSFIAWVDKSQVSDCIFYPLQPVQSRNHQGSYLSGSHKDDYSLI